ncbi:hypothetical protein VTK73DRAFT_7933 [Phialemonium thermophilum]|uniref:MYB DNA-binding domain-containing protein n=1 Tax=Phialemonium thermophilum TaxID=223376 RepID=A0ABR3WC54_9PEZI
MQQWQVGPVPEYLYSNPPNHPNEIHPSHYPQPDMSRRQEHYPYGAPPPQQPGQQQHHPAPVQPSMTHAQPPQGTPHQQPPTPTPAPAPPASRQRKRPASQSAHQPPHAPAHQPAPTPPQPQPIASATPSAVPGTPGQPAGTAGGAAASTGSAVPAPAQPPVGDDASSTPNPPPAKKSRTNTPWTPSEEQRLKQMRDAGSSWAEIAKTFPTRTEGSVKKHWYKDMHYAEFAEDESQALLNAIKDYENNKWKVIGQKVGKPAKACEQYAKEHFPDLFAVPKNR